VNTIINRLNEINFAKKRVLFRVDLNIPQGSSANNYFRAQQIIPTLNYLLEREATVIIATHIGRPKGPHKNYSTSNLIGWFEEHGYHIAFAQTIADIAQLTATNNLVLLENLRFFPGEKDRDAQFAQQLASQADIYVTDAFGALHRNDTSITLVPQLFQPENRSIGLLIEKEFAVLNRITNNEHRPFMLIVGGGKAADKLSLAPNLAQKFDIMAFCPALTSTLLHSLGLNIGTSPVEQSALAAVAKFFEVAQERHTDILLPSDFVVQTPRTTEIVALEQLPEDGIACAIGPDTVESWTGIINLARTIVVNGISGIATLPQTQEYYKQLLTTIAHAPGYKVITGGNTVPLALDCGLAHEIDFFSTGGGVVLEYLAGRTLPGLAPFIAPDKAD
jgi:phosphoglycerate kinase